MSALEYITLRALPLSKINHPAFRALVDKYAGETAPPCVAEGLKKALGENAQ